MSERAGANSPQRGLEAFLDEVRGVMIDAIASTPLGELIDDFHSLLGQGKMLRSRMGYRLEPECNVARSDLVRACAAVEMIHAASLLHDDVIDGGLVRRGAPTFWLERGISGAILLGDLLLFKALDITCGVCSDRKWTHRLVQLTGEVCQAEAEQELLLRGDHLDRTWFNCVRIARQKTGSLFAFIGYALSEGDAALQSALERAGYTVGTAYQLADDILDATGNETRSGKTLGTDEARQKATAVSATGSAGIDPAEQIERLCSDSLAALAPWPRIHEAWARYLELDIRPALKSNIESLAKLQAPIR